MTIPELKTQINILEVGEQLGIQIDKRTKKALCPFHEDKQPSLQFSEPKQIATCFSSNCNAGSMDVVNLVEKKLQLNTHDACNWIKQEFSFSKEQNPISIENKMPAEALGLAKEAVIQKTWQKFQTTLTGSGQGKAYLEKRGLNWRSSEAGYNNGQFHHSGTDVFKESCLEYGLLSKIRSNGKGHAVFGNWAVVFPLKNKENKTVSFYYRTIEPLPNKSNQGVKPKEKHLYLKDRQGLYPSYPKSETKKLILTESIIDAATLKEHLKNDDFGILACYGTNGFTAEHSEVLKELPQLEEVIFWFDADNAGRSGVLKYTKELQSKGFAISNVELPEGEDINSIACNHENKTDLLNDLLNARSSSRASTPIQQTITKQEFSISSETKAKEIILTSNGLNIDNPNKLRYSSETCDYIIRGGVRKELDSLRVTLMISSKVNNMKARVKVDLYEDKQTVKTAKEVADRLSERSDLIESDFYTLTDLLEDHRDVQLGEEEEKKEIIIPTLEKEKCLAFLRKPNLVQNINDLIGKAGVVGEENNRIFLFGLASSYKMQDTLHALIQGSSASGKTHLLSTIIGLMPTEDCISLTRVTESSFYNYDEYELSHKLIGLEDFDGLEENAQLAFRELQSKGMISSSTSGKNEKTGEIKGYVKKVYGPIASLAATTQGEIYEDNMSRCFLVAVDESQDQTLRIIQYQNDVSAGAIKREEQKEIKVFLQNCVRLLKSETVINPYANKINLPPQAHKIRRLNELFQCYVKQITLINQYQRKRTKIGTLITAKEDVITAIEIMFESILLKVDELDGSLRNYYENLKSYVQSKGNKQYEFTRLEVRQELNISKVQQHRFMDQLLDLEYLHQEGYANRGYKYKISYWDNNEKLRSEIREYLLGQVKELQ